MLLWNEQYLTHSHCPTLQVFQDVLETVRFSLTVSFPSVQDWDLSQTVCCLLSTHSWDRQAVNQMSPCECECQLLLSIFISVLSLSLDPQWVWRPSLIPLSLSLSLLALPFSLHVSIPDSHVVQQWGMLALPRRLTRSLSSCMSVKRPNVFHLSVSLSATLDWVLAVPYSLFANPPLSLSLDLPLPSTITFILSKFLLLCRTAALVDQVRLKKITRHLHFWNQITLGSWPKH